MKTMVIVLVAAMTCAGGEVVASPMPARPHVSLKQARAAALKLRPGLVKKSELEREKGGSGLRYSFDIELKGVVYEVGIDAISGRVLENGKA